MSKVDVFNCVRSAIPFPTGNETTTGVSQNENSVFKNYTLFLSEGLFFSTLSI